MPATEVSLCTDDDVTLAASWVLPGTTSEGAEHTTAVVVVHGFAAAKDHPAVVAVATELASGGRPVLTYDSRGHGASGGECTLGDRERLDVGTAVRCALDTAERVVLVGASMGGIAVLNHLAAGSPACAAVVVSTPAVWRLPRNARGVLSVALTQTRLGRFVAARHLRTSVARRPRRAAPPSQQIGRAGCPVAVIHGDLDHFIPVSAAHVLHDSASPPCTIDVVPGMGHGYCTAAVRPIDAAVDWAIGQLAVEPSADREELG